jgi:O-antigen ligase
VKVSTARAISLLSLLVAALCIASLLGLRSAETYEMRGRPVGFPQPVFGAELLRFGVNVALEQYDDETLDAFLNDLAAQGVRYVRQEFRWDDIEPAHGQFDWSASDRIISATQKHGLQILPVLWTTPAWARTPSASTEFPAIETVPPANVDDYAAFVKAFASRYESKSSQNLIPSSPQPLTTSNILAYQIWDEPNLSSAWGNALINPTYYLQLLRAARAAIHEVNPTAPIVLAALAPTTEQSNVNLAPQEYLRKLYQLGGHQAFDIASAKPYGFDHPPADRRVDAGALNFSQVILMHEVMVAHGEAHKAIWAGNFGWNALPANWAGEPSIWGNVTEQQQADYSVQAVQRAAREWPWMGAMFLDVLQPRPRAEKPEADPRWGFALRDPQSNPRPVYNALPKMQQAAEAATRPQLFATCQLPQSVLRTLQLDNVMTAMPEVMSSRPDCTTPNPRAVFTDGWRFEQLGADIPDKPDAKVTVRFVGDELALIVRRGNYRAYTFVTVDGRPANLLPEEPRGAYLIMTSPGLYPVIETIPVASGLGPGEHVAEITVDRGWNQWALIGWSAASGTPAAWGALRIALLGVLALAVAGLVISLPKARVREGTASVASRLRGKQIDPASLNLRAIAVALLFWLTAMLTWATDAAAAYRNLGFAPNVVFTGIASGVLFWSPLMVVSLIALAAMFVLVLLRLEAGLMLLAFFIPFYLQPQRIFQSSFSMVEILTLMCAVSWGLRIVRSGIREWRLRRILNLQSLISNLHLFDWGVIALVIVAVLSALQADFRTEAMRELRLVILEPALVYLMLRTLRNPSPHGRGAASEGMRAILYGFIAGAVAVALIGLFNYAQDNVFDAEFGLPRIKSVFGSANNDALYLERAFVIMLALAAVVVGNLRLGAIRNRQSEIENRKSKIQDFLIPLALIPVGLALLLTQSRGALLLGVPAALIVMCILAGGKWRWAGIGLLALMALAFVVLLSGVALPLLEGTRFANALDLQRGTGFFRINLWQSALSMWRDHPLLGVGPDNFLYAYRSFYILPAAWQEPNLSHPHNVFFDFLARLGLLGVIAGALLIAGYVQLIRRAMPANRALAIGCAGFLAAMLMHGLVDHSFFLIELAYPFMLTAGVLVSVTTTDSSTTTSTSISTSSSTI